MKTVNDLIFVDIINVWTLRSIYPIQNDYQNWKINDLDMICSIYNFLLKEPFQTKEESEEFINSLSLEDFSVLSKRIEGVMLKKEEDKKKGQ